MIENKNSQEKLLTMLTEIYDQLEELEAVLEHSLTDLRGNLYQQQSIRMSRSEAKIKEIEEVFQEQNLVNNHAIEFSKNHKKVLTLELGF